MIDAAAESATQLRTLLRNLGLSSAAIKAAWPSWWSKEAEASSSARAELRFSVARRLGLDPRSLFEESGPRFLWQEEARFKHLSDENEIERAGITSFGRAVAAILVLATRRPETNLRGVTAQTLRTELLDHTTPFVGLLDLLALLWGVGIPVAHLRVFPWPQKRMAAMTATVGERAAVLLAKDAVYPAPITFYLAHELGHIALGHVSPDRLIVDLEEEHPTLAIHEEDEEERSADQFALEVLTGQPNLMVLPDELSARPSATELGRIALEAAQSIRIEPGILAQCYGYSTGDWKTATGALKVIESNSPPVRPVSNELALQDHVGGLHVDLIELASPTRHSQHPQSPCVCEQ